METCVACLLHTPHGQLMQPARMLELLDSDAKPLLRYLSWSLGVKLRCLCKKLWMKWEHSTARRVVCCLLVGHMMCKILQQFISSILSALQQSWFVLHLWTACLSVAQIASSLWRWYRLELSLDSIRHEVVAGMAGAKSLLLFRTLLGPRKVLSQLGDLSIDSILCWSLWFDWASKDLRLLVDDRCGVFRATTAWSTCGLSSGYDYGTRTSGAPFSPTCPDFVQGWTQDHLGLV